MRISDWSSDVCSSDLALAATIAPDGHESLHVIVTHLALSRASRQQQLNHLARIAPSSGELLMLGDLNCEADELLQHTLLRARARTEERRGGTECGSTSRSRWSTDH